MSREEALKERLLRYVSFDTQSSTTSESFPSTPKQLVLMEELRCELETIGAEDVTLDKYGYLMATIPPSKGCELRPVIALIAHVDTSPEVSGEGVKPQIIESYDGGDIALSLKASITVAEYPELLKLIGHTLITTDGETLLGADDKAGVAEIMTVAAELIANPEVEHGRVRICFTPDEEIGAGVDFLDLRALGADFAYTLDGGAEGELEYENFNAASAKIEITGHNHHPGAAKGRMKNALDMANELHSLLPAVERPQYTEGYEGFYHLTSLSGSVERAEMEYIIRDHSLDEFERRKVEIWSIVDLLQKRHGEEAFKLTLKDQYFNMKRMIEPHPELISRAEEAMQEAGVEPIICPIRGGTDGARLSFMGLPCPNLFTGGGNFHSRHEYCSLTTMERAVEVVINLLKLWAK
ncbi:MAG: peptidase T [Rikenellaceae bacterium]